MLAVALELLTGRYGATTYNDRTLAEWPPHPARLFSALVATWADAEERDEAEREVLRWLEAQQPPELRCSLRPEVAERRVVTVYVPVNDARALSTSVDAKHADLVAAGAALSTVEGSRVPAAQAALERAEVVYRKAVAKASSSSGAESPSVMEAVLEMLPEKRNRQPRTYSVVVPADPTVWFIWPAAEPSDGQVRALDGLLGRVARVGHSATLVSCRVGAPPGPAGLVPGEDGGVLLRVPREGLLDRLQQEFERHQGRRERLLPAPMTAYRESRRPRRDAPSGLLSGEWYILPLAQQGPDGQTVLAPRNTRSLDVARAVRDALLEHSGEPGAGFLAGRWPDGEHRPHTAVVPLPDVGHRWGTGLLRGVALVPPRDAAPEHREVLRTALAAWAEAPATVRLAGSGPLVVFDRPRLVPPGGTVASWSDEPYALRRHTWCRESATWVSVSPVALDRYVRGLHDPDRSTRETADDAARAVLSRACVHLGLPEPAEVVVSPVGMVAAVPPAPATQRRGRRPGFAPYVAAGSGRFRQCVHVRLTFTEPVHGPLLIGAGRYLGYGLCLPVDDGRDGHGP